ncbi:Cell surface glycan-binding lipoprotein, utilization system for glycans and polysaccharides (PUL), SusD family [hydrothermal vent metagenome]|uniref:Cell surface glycan-binding lipoprotein, utilization system for glycans and polysaccharides (PUL), SusD family n=1 Tax=hydrothermal vent metagenome TaxID=652676 RepID=A0A3B0T0Y9_9ZZZZ
MNKIYKTLLLLLVMLGLQSCDQDSLLETPAPSLADAAFFTNDEAALNALAGVYDPMGWYNFSQLTEWAIGDVVSDDAEKGGGGDGDYAEIHALATFTANAENPLIAQRWTDLYVGINRANKLIEGITDNDNVGRPIQERLIAEAKFLRGFYLLYLVNTFGAVPIVDHILSPSEFTNPKNTLEECWAQIESDFQAGASGLPRKSQLTSAELGRATWGTASAFLTKAYIFQAKWAEAEATAKTIVNSGEYDLEPNYGDLFTIATDNGIESVFDIQFGDFQSPGWLDEHEGSHLEVIQRSRDDRNGGWGFDQPTQDLYDEYETGDTRRDLTIISDGTILWEGTDDEETIYTAKDPVHHPDSYTGYHKRKGTLPASERGNGEDQAGLNLRVIRFADVLLWQAEAAAHNGSDWQTPVNRVRARVGLGASPITDPIEAVYHERRVELAMEGHRYWDLVRTGRGNLMTGYSDAKRYLLIPQIQINLNPNLQQNPY